MCIRDRRVCDKLLQPFQTDALIPDILQKYHKFISADTGTDIIFPESGLQGTGYLQKNVVAKGMPVGVIKHFKSVHIQHDHHTGGGLFHTFQPPFDKPLP